MVRINISLPEEVISKLDGYTKAVHVSRSGFILNALKNYFAEIERKIPEDKKMEAYEGILKIREKAAALFEGWDSTAEIRKLRDNRWAGNKK